MIQQLPLSVRRSIELLGLVLLALVIVQLQDIIMPILMALVASIALLPIHRFFVRRKIPNSIAISLTVLLMIVVLILIIVIIMAQLVPLVENFAIIKKNVVNHINVISNWLSNKTGISTVQQTQIIQKQTNTFIDSAGNYINNAMGSVSSALVFFGLFPIYTFLILYYKNMLRNFLLMWFPEDENQQVNETLKSVESIIKSYIIGLLIQLAYMTVLLGGTLLLFGIDYAILIAIIFAVLNLIPYIGALVGNIIGVLLTVSSSPDLNPVFTVIIIITVIQLLDNNILMPYVVGSKIRINALVSLVGVFIGGVLAGVSGMFLSLPVMAVFKIAFDHTEQFKKWGVLFGDETPISPPKWIKIKKRNEY